MFKLKLILTFFTKLNKGNTKFPRYALLVKYALLRCVQNVLLVGRLMYIVNKNCKLQ